MGFIPEHQYKKPGESQGQAQHPGGGNWLDSAINSLPTIGGIAGGISGAALGTPFDAISGPLGTALGGVGGAAIGGAGGEGLKNLINMARGKNRVSPMQNLKNMGQQGAIQAPFGALGGEGDIGAGAMEGLAGKGVLQRLIGGALGRFGGGAVAGGVSALAQGQNAPQAAQTGAESGAVNAALPAVGSLLKGVATSHLGNPDNILQGIMDKYLITGGRGGADYTDNPAVTSVVGKNLADPKQAATSLKGAADELYKSQLEPVFKKTAVTAKDFIDALTQNGRYMLSDKEARAINNGFLKLINATDNSTSQALLSNIIDVSSRTGLSNSVGGAAGKTPISLDAIDKFKHAIPYNEDTATLYHNVQKFIEDQAAGTPVADINKTYHALEDAGHKLEQKRLDAGGKIQTGKSMNWGGRLKAGATGAVLGMGGNLALSGNPGSASMYSGMAIPSILTKMISDELSQYPQTAVPYAQGLQTAGNVSGGLMGLLQQLGIRAPGLMSQPQGGISGQGQ